MNLAMIWVELELNVQNYDNYFSSVLNTWIIPTSTSLQTTGKGNRETSGFIPFHEWVKVWLTDEYYSSQCEWKLYPEPLDRLDKVQSCIKHIIKNTPNSIVHKSIPAFVGTHIHLFFKENASDLDHFVRGKTILSAFLMEYFFYFFRDSKKVPLATKCKELERLVFNHNILQKLDYKTLGKWIRKNLNDAGFDYYYTNLPKPKYQPVHWSNPANGKPLTLELRYIPNSFLNYASLETVRDFLTTVEDKVCWINSLSPEEFKDEHNRNKNQCIFWHKQLLEMYKSLQSGNGFWHLPRYSSSSSEIFFDRDHREYSFTYKYKLYMQRMNDHNKAYRVSLREVRTSIKSFLSHRRARVDSVQQLSEILDMWFFMNKWLLMEEFKHTYERPEVIEFQIKSIKDIVRRTPWTYNTIPCQIDLEWDEQLSLTQSTPSWATRIREYVIDMQQTLRQTPYLRVIDESTTATEHRQMPSHTLTPDQIFGMSYHQLYEMNAVPTSSPSMVRSSGDTVIIDSLPMPPF